ncbi:hypothetical protein NHX12_020246 [Muraenolepis orangiensis]|uniref:USP domain-containing protein n=1 Tax=Muraenolepis orangiensis TaxID=630683 RepID=A0A9Q0ISU5_9TELE|nr:hypothetical protein NHX12_020246 [Muraenolepis orangiensis]
MNPIAEEAMRSSALAQPLSLGWGEVKEGLCILGVQALAELDQWPVVLSWVLRQYQRPEEIPATIMQMCILLYAKVGHETAIQEATRTWLFCPATVGLGAYRTVAELYLLCVLLPLGRTDDARQLVLGEVGSRAFSEDQRRLALEVSFYATWELRSILDRWDALSVRDEGLNVPLQLKRYMAAMGNGQPSPHRHFLQCMERKLFRMDVQHDADEVFLAVLDFIQQQMDDPALALEIQGLYQISVELQLQCLQCSCTKRRPSFLLSLPLHIKEGPNSLEDCIVSFFQLQDLSGIDSCFCAECRVKTPSKQGFKLLSLPTILCMQLQRFRNSARGTDKLDCSLAFPDSFDFQDFWKLNVFSQDFQKNGSTKYSLFAVIVHIGSAWCGHYTAYVLVPEHGWFYADDSHVVRATWDDVRATYGGRGRTAYMLLYRRNS